MKNKKIKYKDLCQMVQEQKTQIEELEQTINYIHNNYFCDIPFQAEVAYKSNTIGEELQISYLKDDKVNTITYTLNGFLSFPIIKEIVKQNDIDYIITLQRTKDYYEYYMVNTSNWEVSNVTNIIKETSGLTGMVS